MKDRSVFPRPHSVGRVLVWLVSLFSLSFSGLHAKPMAVSPRFSGLVDGHKYRLESVALGKGGVCDGKHQLVVFQREGNNAGHHPIDEAVGILPGGIREALHFITAKAAERFSTTSCQEATPLILLTTIGIMQTLPPH